VRFHGPDCWATLCGCNACLVQAGSWAFADPRVSGRRLRCARFSSSNPETARGRSALRQIRAGLGRVISRVDRAAAICCGRPFGHRRSGLARVAGRRRACPFARQFAVGLLVLAAVWKNRGLPVCHGWLTEGDGSPHRPSSMPLACRCHSTPGACCWIRSAICYRRARGPWPHWCMLGGFHGALSARTAVMLTPKCGQDGACLGQTVAQMGFYAAAMRDLGLWALAPFLHIVAPFALYKAACNSLLGRG